MALDINKIPSSIRADIRDRGNSDNDIAKMTPKKAFDEYLRWNGIIGYDRLYEIVHYLDDAQERGDTEMDEEEAV